jgi:hypothetical protein
MCGGLSPVPLGSRPITGSSTSTVIHELAITAPAKYTRGKYVIPIS